MEKIMSVFFEKTEENVGKSIFFLQK